MKPMIYAAVLALSPAMAMANQSLSVDFQESAPKDRFTIVNTGDCTLSAEVKIDLAPSAGKLIFDTTATGAGVEVFQPFELVAGQSYVKNKVQITDGDEEATILFDGLAPGKKIAFTIDVDDRLKNSQLGQIRVSNSEIQGGVVMAKAAGATKFDTAQTTFTAQADADLTLGLCPPT